MSVTQGMGGFQQPARRERNLWKSSRSYPEISGAKALVVALGATGIAAAQFLHERGAQVTVSEVRDEVAVMPGLTTLRERGIAVETGGHRLPSFLAADLIVVSPGVVLESPPLRAAAEKGAEIISEIELAYRFIRTPIIAVTGTNGKTTTVKLTAEIFRRAGIEAFLYLERSLVSKRKHPYWNLPSFSRFDAPGRCSMTEQ